MARAKKSVDDVKFALEGANIRVTAATERLDKLSKSGKATATQIAAATHSLEGAKRSAEKYSGQLGVIPAQAARSVAVYKTVTTQTMTMAEAMKAAGEQTRATLAWVQKMAIQSPFDQTGIAKAYKTALTYGFTSKQAKNLTETLVDFAAATGASSDMLDQIAYPLGQIRAGTKVMTQDLRQLMTAGVPVQDILKEMGFSLEDVGKGLVKSDKFLEMFTETMQRDFGGAAKAQAGTFAGLVSSMTDLKDLAMRDLFTPMFSRMQPVLNTIVEALQMPGVSYALGIVGTALGELISGPAAKVGDLFKGVGRAFEVFKNATKMGIKPINAIRLALQTFVPPKLMPAINGIVRAVDAFQTSMSMARDPIAAFKKALEALELPPMLEQLGKVTIDIAGLVLKGDLSGAFGKVDDWLAAAKLFVDKVIDPALAGVLTGVWKGLSKGIDTGVAALITEIDRAIAGVPEQAKQTLADAYRSIGKSPKQSDIAFTTLQMKIEADFKRWADALGPKIWEWFQDGIIRAAATGLEIPLTPQTAKPVPGANVMQGMEAARERLGVTTTFDSQIAQWLADTNKSITDFFNGLSKSLFPSVDGAAKEIGADLGAGIKAGLEEQGTAIGDAGTAAVQTGMDAIKSTFGIASPSTWTAANIGTPLAEGVATGIVAGMGAIENALTVAVLGPLARIAAKALTMAQQMGGAMGGAGTAATGGTATVTVPATIMAMPKFAGISDAAAMPLDILSKITDAVLAYLSGSPIVNVVASLYAKPVYAGVSEMAPMPLDLLTTIRDSVSRYLGIPALDTLVSTYAKPIFQGISAMAQRPLELISQMVARVNKYIGIPATAIPVSVYAAPVFSGISGSAARPLDLMDQMRNAVRNYIGAPVVNIPVRVAAVPSMTPAPYLGPSQSDLNIYGRARGGPVEALRPYIVGERRARAVRARAERANRAKGGCGGTDHHRPARDAGWQGVGRRGDRQRGRRAVLQRAPEVQAVK